MNIEDRTAILTDVAQSSEEPLIVILTQVDPDAIGAFVGMQMIFDRLKVKSEVYYCGNIGHPQTRTILNRYNLTKKMRPYVDFNPPPDSPLLKRTVLLDSSNLKDDRLREKSFVIDPCIIIDHHDCDLAETDDDKFYWVERQGATCTLVAELIFHFGLSLKPEFASIAPLLAIGIYTDTKSLRCAGDRDHHAYRELSAHFPAEEIKRLIEYRLPKSHFGNFAKALATSEQQGAYLVANCGYMRDSDGDDLSTVADYLIRREGVHVAVVYGVVPVVKEGRKTLEVRISARSQDLAISLNAFLQERFGSGAGAKVTSDGYGEGGARIPFDLGFWQSDETREENLKSADKRIKDLIFNK